MSSSLPLSRTCRHATVDLEDEGFRRGPVTTTRSSGDIGRHARHQTRKMIAVSARPPSRPRTSAGRGDGFSPRHYNGVKLCRDRWRPRCRSLARGPSAARAGAQPPLPGAVRQPCWTCCCAAARPPPPLSRALAARAAAYLVAARGDRADAAAIPGRTGTALRSVFQFCRRGPPPVAALIARSSKRRRCRGRMWSRQSTRATRGPMA